MIDIINITPQAKLNVFNIEYKHNGVFKEMMQRRVVLSDYYMRTTSASAPEADAYLEKLGTNEDYLKRFINDFLMWFHDI